MTALGAPVLPALALLQALTWSAIDKPRPLRSNQELKFGQTASFPPGTGFRFLSVQPLKTVPVTRIRLRAEACADPKARSEMVVLNNTVGVELHPECVFEIYVEQKGLGTPSVFDGG